MNTKTLVSPGTRMETSGSTPSLFATSGAFSSSLGFSSGVSSGLSLGPLGVTGVGLLRLPSLATFVFELSSPPENKNIAATIATSATPPTAPPMMSICLFLAPALLGPFWPDSAFFISCLALAAASLPEALDFTGGAFLSSAGLPFEGASTKKRNLHFVHSVFLPTKVSSLIDTIASQLGHCCLNSPAMIQLSYELPHLSALYSIYLATSSYCIFIVNTQVFP